MPKTVSGKKAVNILTTQFGFVFVSQKGSHVKLHKITSQGIITTIVPMHRELARGTMRGIVRLAKIDYKDFEQYL